METTTFVLLLMIIAQSNSLKILGIFPYVGKSHFFNFEPVMKELALRGHHVTIISHFPQKSPLKNYRDIILEDISDQTVDVVEMEHVLSIPLKVLQFFNVFEIAQLGDVTCNYLETPVLEEFISAKDEKFDLLLIEQFDTDCYLGFVHKYKAPWIGISSHIVMPFTNDRYGGIDNPSIVPNHFLGSSDRMTFIQRLENTIANVFHKIVHRYRSQLPAESLARKYFGRDLPDLWDLSETSSLLLVNTHFTLNLPRPLVPNWIEIGGVHTWKEPEKLPTNIEKWINESTHGVIYFSMGSIIRGHTFPHEKRLAFFNAFKRLKQRVLWKWETDSMPDQPDNVMIQKWMPQFDILCHSNVKAFIGHGGLLGMTEAVYNGVPMLVMPQFGDQHTNAKALEASGGGIILNFRDVTEDSVYNALQAILTPEFNTQAKELSERFRDRPMPPLDTAIYWIEYVARHKGAHHMKTAAVGMPLYQYLLLDVLAFLSAIVLSFMYISCKMTTFFYGKICIRSTSKKTNTAKSGKSKKTN